MRQRSRWHRTLAWAASAVLLASCGGGGGGGGSPPPPPPSPPSPGAPPSLYSVPTAASLSVADVEKIIAQAVAEARARNAKAVIAVTDRVGNVLAVFAMTDSLATDPKTPTAPDGTKRDLQDTVLPRSAVAITKAITGAYLSSGGNAFSTRTASMIVQEHFPKSPATAGLESGPLFGVQFSSLPCSDLNARYEVGVGAGAGPKRSPFGLSADSGGFPLYKNGVLVGGIGVSSDASYGIDENVLDIDSDLTEEYIALAGLASFEAPAEITANMITVDGTALRYSDATTTGLMSTPASAPAFATINNTQGQIRAVPGYFGLDTPTIKAGVAFGSVGSGYTAAAAGQYASPDAFVVSDRTGVNRFPIRAGLVATGGATPMSASEVKTLLDDAFGVMSDARAQIRRPLNSRAQVTISVVDTAGNILGVVRSPDAPVFGTDVSLQKARTAALFSLPDAGTVLTNAKVSFAPFVANFRALVSPTALNGSVAYPDRAIGNLARPMFPDGRLGADPGPLSYRIGQWSPFATGIQSSFLPEAVDQHIRFLRSQAGFSDFPLDSSGAPGGCSANKLLGNGFQIFPGSVPIYRGDKLVGAIGVSGDGIDQDDMISFLGLARASGKSGVTIGNAPLAMRSDNVVIQGTRLRYVNCPFSPLLSTSEQNVCQGL